MFTALTDIGQPYSCNQWGNVGQDNLPMIINDENGWGNHFFNWFNTGSAMPSNVFIDHNMNIFYKTNFVSYNLANNKINEMLDNCGVLCDGLEPIYGCMDINATNYDINANVEDGTCDYGIIVDFGSYNGFQIDINIETLIPIAGFQFLLNSDSSDFYVNNISNGIALENEFTINTNDLGLILGFSLTGNSIPIGQNLLTTISYTGGFNSEICIEDLVISSYEIGELNASSDECIYLNQIQQIGDCNMDGLLNIIDIVILVNVIIDNLIPSEYQIISCDLNHDGNINIVDIVLIINEILD
tara:strand:+ start:599 stop:1498 length:900 start_codon:yes stop_codon:yes gene_type:complete